MKVGFYISQIMYGGAEKVLVNLANGFDAKGFEVVLITTMRERCEPETNPSIKRYVINEEKDVKEELVEDMMSLIASFSGKLYGMRSKTNKGRK